MFRSFFLSRAWWPHAYGGTVALLVALICQALISLAMNSWYGAFYNHLQDADTYTYMTSHEGVMRFYELLFSLGWLWDVVRVAVGFDVPLRTPSFLAIMLPHICLSALVVYLARRWTLWWREAITMDIIPRWRAATNATEGASQRIQEDADNFARIIQTLGTQTVRGLILLVMFLPLLWHLSRFIQTPFIDGMTTVFIDEYDVVVPMQVDGVRYVSTRDGIEVVNDDYIPGILVWIAILVTVGGLYLSWLVGQKLPLLERGKRETEAALRTELEKAERERWRVLHADEETVLELFTGIRINHKRLYAHSFYLDLWIDFYDQFVFIIPYVLVGPSLFGGAVLLGVMVQVKNCFDKVHRAISLPIHNWDRITELRAIVFRLRELERDIERSRAVLAAVAAE